MARVHVPHKNTSRPTRNRAEMRGAVGGCGRACARKKGQFKTLVKKERTAPRTRRCPHNWHQINSSPRQATRTAVPVFAHSRSLASNACSCASCHLCAPGVCASGVACAHLVRRISRVVGPLIFVRTGMPPGARPRTRGNNSENTSGNAATYISRQRQPKFPHCREAKRASTKAVRLGF